MTQIPGSEGPIDEQALLALEALAEQWSDGEEPGMPLEALDGYFSALVVGPGKQLAMGDYLQTAMGNDWVSRPGVDTEQAVELLMRFWNHIAWRVAQPLPDEDDTSEQAMAHGFALMPLVGLPEVEEGGQVDPDDPLRGVSPDFPVGALWATGFMQGVVEHAGDWEQWMLEDEDLAEDLRDLSGMTLVDPAQADELGLDWEQRPDFEQRWDLLLSVPALLQDLNLWRIEDLVSEPIRAVPQPGRNDPCPCGSGKKWKKCCAGTLH